MNKIIALFKNIHFQSLAGNGVMAVFSMVTIAILYRALSINDIGVYVFFMTVSNLVDTLKGGFLTIPYIKFYSGADEARTRDVAGSSWVLVIIIAGALVLLNLPALFALPYIKVLGVIVFIKYFSLTFVSTVPSFMANLAVQSEKRFDRLLWLRLINQVLFTGAVLVLIFLHKSTLDAVLISFVAANALTSIITFLLGWTKFGQIKHFTRKTMAEITNFGKYSVGTSISANLFAFTDTMMITFFLGAPGLAMYNLGIRLNQIVEIPMLSFAASGMPILSAFYNQEKKDEMMYTMKKIIGMLSMAIIVIAICAVIFAEPIIAILGGQKYAHTQAPNLFRIFIIITILYPADRFMALMLDVIQLPKINFYKVLVMLAANLAADYLGLALYKSVYVIAIANIFPTLVAIIMAYIPLNRYYKFNFWNIYAIGYKESMLFIRQTYKLLLK